MIRALIAGTALAFAAGPVGCFILWKKMAYFGDTLAHSALLGVALSLILQVEALIGVFMIALLVSFSLILLRRMAIFSSDTALGILSHSALASGLIALSLAPPGSVHLNTILFGDILAVSWSDVWVSIIAALIILAVMAIQWRPLIAHTFSRDIAEAEGLGSARNEMLFMVLCSGLVAIAMKITGILLISALLIIPAATGRLIARSPEYMAVFAIGFAVFSVIGGLLASLEMDLPSGPAIIATASVVFLWVMFVRQIFRRGKIDIE